MPEDVYDKIEDAQDDAIEQEYIQQMADRLGGGNVVDVRDSNTGFFSGNASTGKQVYNFLKKHNIPAQVTTRGSQVYIWVNGDRGKKTFR